jgi:hypothetical protein
MLCIHHLCVLDKCTLTCRQHMFPGFLHIYPQETYLEMTVCCLIPAVTPPTEGCDLIITSVTDLLVLQNAATKSFTHHLSINAELTYVSENIHVLLFTILGFLAFCLFFGYIYQVTFIKICLLLLSTPQISSYTLHQKSTVYILVYNQHEVY